MKKQNKPHPCDHLVGFYIHATFHEIREVRISEIDNLETEVGLNFCPDCGTKLPKQIKRGRK